MYSSVRSKCTRGGAGLGVDGFWRMLAISFATDF
jgi:hypothetical protein